jgi:hypothetical protein
MILAFFEICFPDNSSSLKKTIMLAIKEASTVPLPIIPTTDFGKYFLPNPLIKKPMKGRRGIKRIKFFMLSFQPSALSRQLIAES